LKELCLLIETWVTIVITITGIFKKPKRVAGEAILAIVDVVDSKSLDAIVL
jgi:hypothetical protein